MEWRQCQSVPQPFTQLLLRVQIILTLHLPFIIPMKPLLSFLCLSLLSGAVLSTKVEPSAGTSTVIGARNKVDGEYNAAVGDENDVFGNSNGVFGSNNLVVGNGNLAGDPSDTNSHYNSLIGDLNLVNGNFNAVVGSKNDIIGSSNGVKGNNVKIQGNGNMVEGFVIGSPARSPLFDSIMKEYKARTQKPSLRKHTR